MLTLILVQREIQKHFIGLEHDLENIQVTLLMYSRGVSHSEFLEILKHWIFRIFKMFLDGS